MTVVGRKLHNESSMATSVSMFRDLLVPFLGKADRQKRDSTGAPTEGFWPGHYALVMRRLDVNANEHTASQ